MSTRLMAACWPMQMPPTPKAVLVSLADNANDAGFCWPSIDTICERTCFGRTAVINAIKWLEDGGYLVADRSNGRHTTYQLTIEDGAHADQPPQPVREADRSARRTRPADGPNQSARRTQPVREADTNRQEPSRTKSKSVVRASAPDARGTRLPDDWTLPDDWRAWAEAEYPDVNPDAEALRFADYWHGRAGAGARKANWQATWRNWIRRAAETAGGHNGTRTQGRRPSVVEQVEANIRARREAEAAAAGRAGRTLGTDGEPVRPRLEQPVRHQPDWSGWE